MIVGIDETGDFRLNSKEICFFVAIHIDQNLDKLIVKERQFSEWEASIPEINRSEIGEVKGRLLTDSQLEDFYHNVLIRTPRSHFSVVEYLPSHNSLDTLNKHKQWIINQIEQVMEDYRNTNRPNWAKRYNEILRWSKNLSHQEIVKMRCLHHLLAMSFNQSFIYSQLSYLHDKDESNLKEVAFKIDKDFVRAPNVRKFWDEHFSQFWRNLPVEFLPSVISDSEVITNLIRKYFEIDGDQISITKSFNENTTFLDSKESFEIRMADIFGTILHRHHNKGLRCESIWNSLVGIIEIMGKEIPIYSRLTLEK